MHYLQWLIYLLEAGDIYYFQRGIWSGKRNYCYAACRWTGLTIICTDTETGKTGSSVWWKISNYWFPVIQLYQFRYRYGRYSDTVPAACTEWVHRKWTAMGSGPFEWRCSCSPAISEGIWLWLVQRNSECDLSEYLIYWAVWSKIRDHPFRRPDLQAGL